ncbi:hypothetical protein [Stenoxybacter acetivorans]|uniref:hypothetical protein n=1 Tax=Stenoxybacter acetivorans TaxID=422441 RepID=UPI000563316C|nr:hypothetical protein [Stenoxybacter acetivorans]
MPAVKIKEEISNKDYSKAEKRCAITLILICFILVLIYPLIAAIVSEDYILDSNYSVYLSAAMWEVLFILLPVVPMIILRPVAVSAEAIVSIGWFSLWHWYLIVTPNDGSGFMMLLFDIIPAVLSAVLNLIFSIVVYRQLFRNEFNRSSAAIAAAIYAVWSVLSFAVSYLLVQVVLLVVDRFF